MPLRLRALGETAEGSHLFKAADGFEGAQEDTSGIAFGQVGGSAADVGAVVISINEVDVGVAGRSEENRVARGLAAVGVGTGVEGAEVGLGFDDASGEESWLLALLFPTFANGKRMWATRGRWR
jgi:hypothetical protein